MLLQSLTATFVQTVKLIQSVKLGALLAKARRYAVHLNRPGFLVDRADAQALVFEAFQLQVSGTAFDLALSHVAYDSRGSNPGKYAVGAGVALDSAVFSDKR